MEKKEDNHIGAAKTEKGDPDSVYKQKPRRNNRPKKDEFDELMKRDEKDDGPTRGGGDVEKTVSIFLEKVRKAVNKDPDALKRVIMALDGAEFGDEKLSVRTRGGGGGRERKARSERPRMEREKRETRPEPVYVTDPCHLYIGNLAYATEEDALHKDFSEFGEIVKLKIAVGRENRSLGKATVQFKNEKDAEACIEKMNGKEIDGRQIFVKVDQKRK